MKLVSKIRHAFLNWESAECGWDKFGGLTKGQLISKANFLALI
jgi:hypothetical protein